MRASRLIQDHITDANEPGQFGRAFSCPHTNTERNQDIMAIVLEANYAKKLGLPNFSSHQYCVTIRTELTDLSQVEAESARLYALLQAAVDREIQEVGFMPDASRYGMNNGNNQPTNGGGNGHPGNGNGSGNGHPSNGNNRRAPAPASDGWNCTEGQKGFVLRIINESKLDKNEVEAMAQQLFGIGVKELDKLQASQLIEELLEKTGRKTNGRRSPWQGRQPARA